MSFRPTLSLSVCLALAALSCAPGAVPLSRCVTAPTRTVTPSPALAVDALDDSPQIPVAGAPSLGPANAPVTIVAFSDFECPFCNRGRNVLADLRAAHPDEVRIVWRNLPLPRHTHARLAAEAALEAFAQGGNDAFWRFHDIAFGHQEHLARADLERYAALVGLDLPRFRDALDRNAHAAEIDADIALGTRLGADGTPAFFVNGTPIAGALPIDVFEGLTAALVERARASNSPRTFYADTVRTPLPTPERPSTRPSWATVHEVPIPAGAPSLGPENAPVVMQVFSDFQCPYCARVEPTLAALRERFGDRLRIVWRDFPLAGHPDAMPAAETAREVLAQRGVEYFWRFHDALFEHQRDEEGLSTAALERHAIELGTNPVRLRQALADHRHQAAIRVDMDAITATGVRFGTPAFFLNGHFMSGARPLAEFAARINSLLPEAQRVAAP